jgi:hypothetical protein
MSIYISKNNQQSGPFDESKVLEMLNSGQLSPDDFAIRQGSSQWQKLGEMFPPQRGRQESAQAAAGAPAFDQTPPVAQAAAAQATPKKSRKGLLLGCLGFLMLSGLIVAALGFLAYRNLNPAESRENLPDTVKDFKLDNRYPPKGDIWGSETRYVGIYKNGTDTVIYLMTVYGSETAAKDALRSELASSCKSGETPMYFSFLKNSSEVSQGATCAVPLYVQKDNKLVTLAGPSAGVDAFIEFAENLPFNAGAEMKKKGEK